VWLFLEGWYPKTPAALAVLPVWLWQLTTDSATVTDVLIDLLIWVRKEKK